MIAYALRAMSFFDRLRKMLAGPAHIQGGDDEGEAALNEEYGAHDEGAAELSRVEQLSGGAVIPGRAAAEGAEAAADDLATEEAPPDPSP